MSCLENCIFYISSMYEFSHSLGQKRKRLRSSTSFSGLPPATDIRQRGRHVGSVSKAELGPAPHHSITLGRHRSKRAMHSMLLPNFAKRWRTMVPHQAASMSRGGARAYTNLGAKGYGAQEKKRASRRRGLEHRP